MNIFWYNLYQSTDGISWASTFHLHHPLWISVDYHICSAGFLTLKVNEKHSLNPNCILDLNNRNATPPTRRGTFRSSTCWENEITYQAPIFVTKNRCWYMPGLTKLPGLPPQTPRCAIKLQPLTYGQLCLAASSCRLLLPILEHCQWFWWSLIPIQTGQKCRSQRH